MSFPIICEPCFKQPRRFNGGLDIEGIDTHRILDTLGKGEPLFVGQGNHQLGKRHCRDADLDAFLFKPGDKCPRLRNFVSCPGVASPLKAQMQIIVSSMTMRAMVMLP